MVKAWIYSFKVIKSRRWFSLVTVTDHGIALWRQFTSDFSAFHIQSVWL